MPDDARPGDPVPAHPVTIRPMQAGDLSAVLEVERETLGAPHWSLEDYEDCLAAPSSTADDRLMHTAWVAETAAGIVGFAVVRRLVIGDRAECELESLAVRPPAQRRGVGSALLGAVIAALKISGASILLLEVRASNHHAQRLYERFGLAKTGLRRGYYGGLQGRPPEDAVLMQLSFPRASGFSRGIVR